MKMIFSCGKKLKSFEQCGLKNNRKYFIRLKSLKPEIGNRKLNSLHYYINYSENEAEFSQRIQKTSLWTFSGFSLFQISEFT